MTSDNLDVRGKAAIAGVVLAVFGVFTLWVMAGHGILGFLVLAGEDPWALQMLLDLGIALWFGLGWLIADARRRGLAAWPFVVATPLVGSPGLLAYVAYRGIARGLASGVTPRPGT